MAERKTVVNKTLSYDGLVSVQGIYRLLRDFLDEHGYNPYEADHREQVFPDGKEIVIKIAGATKLSDYAKMLWETEFTFTHMREMIVEKEGQKVKMYQCSTALATHILLETHYDGSSEQKPLAYFIRVLIDKFVIKNYLYKAEKRGQKDYALFEQSAKSFLNMEKF
jgi:hypothetical protein